MLPMAPALAALLSNDSEFRRHARYMQATIVLRGGQQEVWLGVRQGQVEVLPTQPSEDTEAIVLSGRAEAWASLAMPGGLQRAFRHGQIRLEGDRISGMRYWKALTRLADLVGSEGRAVRQR